MLAAESVAFALSPLATESAQRLSGVVVAALSAVSPLLLFEEIAAAECSTCHAHSDECNGENEEGFEVVTLV